MISHLIISNVKDTDSLNAIIHSKFPAMSDAKYVIAVNNQIIFSNTILQSDYTVAFLPPFSGG
jgi:sulfur-carrier protein